MTKELYYLGTAVPSILDSLVTSVKSSFANAQTTFNNFVNDTRAVDSARPRLSSSDPTQAIDKNDTPSVLTFPADRPKYYITFAFKEYQRPNQFSPLSSSGLKDYICLPLPNNLQDRNHLGYNAEEGSFLVESGNKVIQEASNAWKTGGVDGLQTASGNIASAVGSMGTGYGINRAIGSLKNLEKAGDAVGLGTAGITKGTLQTLGLAENPFSTVAFTGPTFKQHNFTWRLAARSPDESKTITAIFNSFKKNAHPEILNSNVGGFYKYPMIVWPKFQPDEVIPNLYKFKPCVIVDININHSPNDRPGFYGDTSAPIEIVIELSLMEIELWRNGGDYMIGGTNLGIGSANGDFSDVTSARIVD